MNISLTPELESLVHRKVETGRYKSASEVIGEALRALDERDQLFACGEGEIDRKIAAGMASLRAGRSTDGEGVFERIDAELNAAERPDPA